MDMFNSLIDALVLLVSPDRILWLIGGVLLGMLTGLLPGLGGIVGMTLMFPFIYGMDPYGGIALLIGIIAVNVMSDSFPAVLFGIPGSSAAAATIMDGYPLAKQGRGARTLGTVFFVSGIGGVIGGIALLAIIPVARPVVMAMESPELLMLTVFGVSMVGVLARGSAIKGIAGGFVGLLLSTIGSSLVGTDYRFTFGSLYLWDGLSISIVAMGLFAIPEFIDMLVHPEDRPSASNAVPRSELKAGVIDAWKHKWLVLRSSLAGVVLGAIPGISPSVIQWILYGTTIQFARDKSRFGKGDIRGVIAPESACCSSEGGGLIPTLFFGIPSSGGKAVMLAGFFLLGVEVGPSLLRREDGMTIVLLVVWTLVIANLASMVLCMAMAPWMAKLTTLPSKILTPFLFVIISLAAYQSARHIMDIVMMLIIGALAWAFQKFHWSRAAVLIGFVLGTSLERYLTISMTRYGGEWMIRPGVLALAAVIAISVFFAARMKPGDAAQRHAEKQVEDAQLDTEPEGVPA